jgi:hypothetical protein
MVPNRLTTVRKPSLESNTFPRSRYFFYSEEGETRSSETSIYNNSTRRHISEDGILHGNDRSAPLKCGQILC